MTDPDPTQGPTDRTDGDCHAIIDLEDGGFILYDRENPEAWVQATGSESVLEVRP